MINKNIKINHNQNSFKKLLCLLFLFLLNSINFLYLGDGGAYLLGFLSSYYLIKFSNLNINISPYYIILLLWYPAFENLFSIIRKSFYKKIAGLPRKIITLLKLDLFASQLGLGQYFDESFLTLEKLSTKKSASN